MLYYPERVLLFLFPAAELPDRQPLGLRVRDDRETYASLISATAEARARLMPARR